MSDKWISVEDRLPDYNKHVLLFMLGNPLWKPRPPLFTVGYLKRVDSDGPHYNLNEGDSDEFTVKVTHWQPLPKLPSCN